MNLYYVAGVRNDAFVQCETLEEAIRKALPVVGAWEHADVYRAEWQDGILRAVGEVLNPSMYT
jgi:hypothetical protein